jgi:hypothetical protein
MSKFKKKTRDINWGSHQLIFGSNSWDEQQTQSNKKLDSWHVGRK